MKPLFFFLIFVCFQAFSQTPQLCLQAKDAIERGCPRNRANDEKCVQPLLAYHVDSCLADKDKSNLIKEILDLKKQDTIASSVYDNYDSEKIAKTLIYRVYRDLEMNKVSQNDHENSDFDFYEDSEIHMAFHESVFAQIVKKGFLNQHQTGTSGGSLNTDRRFRVENGLVGLSLERTYSGSSGTKVHKVRPKYAYWVPTKGHSNIAAHAYRTQYGNVFAVLKSAVKKRTTFTNGDSLDYDSSSSRTVHTFGYVTANPKISKLGNYYEAQVWGELNLSHVKYLMINCPGQSSVNSSFLETVRELTPDLPIYSCAEKNTSQMQVYIPGNLLQGKISDPEGSGISVIKATKDGPAAQTKFAEFCENKMECNFDVKSLTDQENFSVSYVCTGKQPKIITIKNYAQVAKVSIDCEKDIKTVKFDAAIKITSATYGTGLPEIKEGNVTEAAAKFCDGKNVCEYTVKTKFIGDPAPDKPKAFDIVWDCLLAKDTIIINRRISIPADATGKSITLNCEDKDMPKP